MFPMAAAVSTLSETGRHISQIASPSSVQSFQTHLKQLEAFEKQRMFDQKEDLQCTETMRKSQAESGTFLIWTGLSLRLAHN